MSGTFLRSKTWKPTARGHFDVLSFVLAGELNARREQCQRLSMHAHLDFAAGDQLAIARPVASTPATCIDWTN